MSDVSAFFGTGYKEKEKKSLNQTEGYIKAIRGTLEPDEKIEEIQIGIDPAVSSDKICINVMGKIYKGDDKIEISCGKIMIDGVSKGEMPNTSGVWFKVLKGKIIQNEKKTLTIIS